MSSDSRASNLCVIRIKSSSSLSVKGYTQEFHDHKWTQAMQAIMALFPPRNACRIFMCQNTKADMTTFLPDQTNDEKQIRAISI